MTYTQAMSFSDLTSEVQGLRFNASQTTQIQRWINARYAELWNSDEWIFKYGKSNVTVTAGSTAVTNLPTDFGISLGLFRDDGYPVLYRPPRDFFDLYVGLTDTGSPMHFTILDQQITVGPTPDTTSALYQLIYEKRFTALVADDDLPAIPPAHHYLLVNGAMSLGLSMYNDFTWEFQEQVFQAGIQAMRREWLADQRGEVTEWGRDQIEALPTAWGV